jgi:hypothetical protein
MPKWTVLILEIREFSFDVEAATYQDAYAAGERQFDEEGDKSCDYYEISVSRPIPVKGEPL